MWTSSKLKPFVHPKETIKRMKKQPTEWEKIFTNPVSDKELITKIYKEFLQFDNKKQCNSKMDKGLE